MSGMPLFIHTYGRPYKQTTFSWFGDDLRARTYFVIQERETERFKLPEFAGVLILPDNIRTLSPTRQWILEWAVAAGHEKICMMDDDLRFSHRNSDGTVKLYHSQPGDISNMFHRLEDLLTMYVHAGVSAREGNNRVEEEAKTITRMMRVLAYRPREVLELGCRFDRIRTKQDFDMTLQLLRLGRANAVLYNHAQDQGGSQESGGCSSYRTPQMMAEDAENLRALHPDFVKVVKKTTKGSWGGGERVDVQIAWKKAFERGGVTA